MSLQVTTLASALQNVVEIVFLLFATRNLFRPSHLIADCFKLYHHGPLQEQSLLVRLY